MKQVLEVGSGTGQHAVHFGAAMPWLTWQTADTAEERCPASGCGWSEANLPNLRQPLELEVAGALSIDGPSGPFDAVFTANTLHIMSWPEVRDALSPRWIGVLARNAVLAVYGPFNYGGKLHEREQRGVQRVAEAAVLGSQRHPRLRSRGCAGEGNRAEARSADYAMPANNRTLVWKRGG